MFLPAGADARTLVSRRRRQAQEGESCLGYAGTLCEAGLRCKTNGSTGGTCVPYNVLQPIHFGHQW